VSNCLFCRSKFAAGHKHNCRLCGQLVCSSCSAKFHLPRRFDLKNKRGPQRVCYRCRDEVLDRVEEEYNSGVRNPHVTSMFIYHLQSRKRPSNYARDLSTGRFFIHKPRLVAFNSQNQCTKCRTWFSSPRSKVHCRVCGNLYCGDCTRKFLLPAAFKIKGDSDKPPVCDYCRFAMFTGAEVSSEEIPEPPPLPGGEMRPSASSFSSFRKSRSIADMLSGTGGAAAAAAAAAPAPAAASSDARRRSRDKDTCVVRWEHSSENLAMFEDPTRSRDLSWVHKELVRVRPELAQNRFSYLVRGRPVWREHWDIFSFRHFAPVLLLRLDGAGDTAGAAATAEALSADASREGYTGGTADGDDDGSETKHGHGHTAAAAGGNIGEQLRAVALYDYRKAGDRTHLELKAGQELVVLKRHNEQWWYGAADAGARRGWFPASYVRLISLFPNSRSAALSTGSNLNMAEPNARGLARSVTFGSSLSTDDLADLGDDTPARGSLHRLQRSTSDLRRGFAPERNGFRGRHLEGLAVAEVEDEADDGAAAEDVDAEDAAAAAPNADGNLSGSALSPPSARSPADSPNIREPVAAALDDVHLRRRAMAFRPNAAAAAAAVAAARKPK
jgi:hypothetical protein